MIRIESHADSTLNIAATAVAAESLGPGHRGVVWVQGCPFSCRGCIAPEWIPNRAARLVSASALAAELVASGPVDGLTLSGGEPMAQAAGLAELVRQVRSMIDVSVICFTGFTLARLRSAPPTEGVADLLRVVDVLIDGTYVESRNHGRGLPGSSNQVVHHLTDRLRHCGYDFTDRRRTAQVRIDDRAVTVVGVPPPGLLRTLDEVVDRFTSATRLEG